jgi:hypothetical protein
MGGAKRFMTGRDLPQARNLAQITQQTPFWLNSAYAQSGHPAYNCSSSRSISMAKSQLRGNREAKKPKQPQKPKAPAAPFGATTSAGSVAAEVRKK